MRCAQLWASGFDCQKTIQMTFQRNIETDRHMDRRTDGNTYKHIISPNSVTQSILLFVYNPPPTPIDIAAESTAQNYGPCALIAKKRRRRPYIDLERHTEKCTDGQMDRWTDR